MRPHVAAMKTASPWCALVVLWWQNNSWECGDGKGGRVKYAKDRGVSSGKVVLAVATSTVVLALAAVDYVGVAQP